MLEHWHALCMDVLLGMLPYRSVHASCALLGRCKHVPTCRRHAQGLLCSPSLASALSSYLMQGLAGQEQQRPSMLKPLTSGRIRKMCMHGLIPTQVLPLCNRWLAGWRDCFWMPCCHREVTLTVTVTICSSVLG